MNIVAFLILLWLGITKTLFLRLFTFIKFARKSKYGNLYALSIHTVKKSQSSTSKFKLYMQVISSFLNKDISFNGRIYKPPVINK